MVAKFSMSLDGKIATSQGESKWITGASARASVHALRSDYDSIMVGIGTVLKDNPKLTVRGHPRHDGNQPLRVIVDSALFDIRAIDEVVCYIAPSIIGGVGALTAVGGKGITQLQDALQLQNITITPIGEDVMITGYPR